MSQTVGYVAEFTALHFIGRYGHVMRANHADWLNRNLDKVWEGLFNSCQMKQLQQKYIVPLRPDFMLKSM